MRRQIFLSLVLFLSGSMLAVLLLLFFCILIVHSFNTLSICSLKFICIIAFLFYFHHVVLVIKQASFNRGRRWQGSWVWGYVYRNQCKSRIQYKGELLFSKLTRLLCWYSLGERICSVDSNHLLWLVCALMMM